MHHHLLIRIKQYVCNFHNKIIVLNIIYHKILIIVHLIVMNVILIII